VLLSKSQGDGAAGAWNCGRCRHAWRTEPWKLSDPAEFFGQAHYTKIESARRLDETKAALFEFFARYAGQATPQQPRLMVDFGCSYGTVLQMFKDQNWQVMGIEISPSAQKILDSRNLRWAPSMEESGLSPGSVDVVVMADSMYYLSDPISVMRTVRSYMKSNGLLLLRQPTRGGLVRLLSRLSRANALAAGLWLDHVHLFSRRSTSLVLNQAGFVEVQFLIEGLFKRSLKGEMIHRFLRAMDYVTLRRLDLVASWTVIAKAAKVRPQAVNSTDS
jgi:SAM-dependent methyltransferase